MTFLSPMTIALAAGLTVPPLIALYFLKLKRVVRPVPSTLLWRRAIEDLRVNAPFQRLRSSLLLWLQLAVLVLAALALGQPMLETAQKLEDTVILLIDQSASMGVTEPDGQTRLEKAKELAVRQIDGMSDGSRAMVIAFGDRATVQASFDTDKAALKRKIASIEQTQAPTRLGEAVSLAEAYTQISLMGAETGGDDRPPGATAAPATVFLFTDGRIEDVTRVSLQAFDASRIRVTRLGERSDNVGIVAMDARRNPERPELLEVAATIENFSGQPRTIDAALYVAGRNVDIQSVTLAAAPHSAETSAGDRRPAVAAEERPDSAEPLESAATAQPVAVAAFAPMEYEGGGVVEVMLRVDDALSADDRAWAIVDEPRHVRVLLVSKHPWLLRSALSAMPLTLLTVTPEVYESMPEDRLREGERSAYDLVMFDRHSTSRLPPGNYFFWGSVPRLAGVSAGDAIRSEVIVNWDETHPILRHTAVETLSVFEWQRLRLPPEATAIIEGESSPVLAYLPGGGSQFLISAFALAVEDDEGRLRFNTDWTANVDFVVFLYNTVQYLTSNVGTRSRRSVTPGEAVTLPVPPRTEAVTVTRPDGSEDRAAAAEAGLFHYARTQRVGAYRVTPAVPGAEAFAVNLFNRTESNIRPTDAVTLGGERIEAKAESLALNRPAWRYFLLAGLGFLLLEWIVYNRRVFV
ncbi:MAG: VWA domain-containing protein [Planctomycetes bacterium]|nr:VWA domain-containing protein [Planctomycetota bacterium]